VSGQLAQHPQRRHLTERPVRDAGELRPDLSHRPVERTFQILLGPPVGPLGSYGEDRPLAGEQPATGQLAVRRSGRRGGGSADGVQHQLKSDLRLVRSACRQHGQRRGQRVPRPARHRSRLAELDQCRVAVAVDQHGGRLTLHIERSDQRAGVHQGEQ
jgi:hypothetical protein